MDIGIPPYFTSWLAVVPFLVKFKKAGTKLGKFIRWIIKATSTDMVLQSSDAWAGQTALGPSERETLLPDSRKHCLGFQGTRIDEVSNLRTLYIVHSPTGKLVQGRQRDSELWEIVLSSGSTGGQYTPPPKTRH